MAPSASRYDVSLLPLFVSLLSPFCAIHSQSDIVVFCTGFDTVDFCSGIDIRGVGGKSLATVWHGEPKAYYGILIPDFPNVSASRFVISIVTMMASSDAAVLLLCSCSMPMGPTQTLATHP